MQYLIFALFCSVALACTNYKVTATRLNARSGPSTTATVKTVYAQDKVLCIQSITSNGWAMTSDGYYVSSGYITKVETPAAPSTPADSCINYYATAVANIRSGPATSYTIKGTTKKGEKYCVYSVNNGWCKIIYNSATCYVSASYLSTTAAPVADTPANPVGPRDISAGAAECTTNIQRIWDYLYSQIGNKYGVAGLMGNLKAESGFNPCNLQNSYEASLGYNDVSYTNAVDQGKYDRFGKDAAGYGLAQWTYGKRKLNLLEYANNKKTSIGNLQTQLEFLVSELKSSFSVVWSTLKNAKSIYQASNSVLLKFEKPANQGTTVQNTRASYGQTIYNTYAK